ncbi:hypothetical protein ACFLTJ_00250 [Chloroflexota bacterium]
MAQEPQEKWQIALKHWGTWVESINKARTSIEQEHGDLTQLLSLAETVWSEDVQDSSGISRYPVRNKEAEILWNLYDKVGEIGSKFIATAIGLRANSELHKVSLDYWVHLVLPELTEDYNPDYYSQEYIAEHLAKKERAYFWHFSKPTVWLGNDEIIDSIHWCRGKLNTGEIIEKLQKTKWPSIEYATKKAASGRPSEEDKMNLEAIVCYVLNRKQRPKFTYKEIASIFSWKTHTGSSGSLTSNTVRNRVKLGKELLQRYGYGSGIINK